MTHDEVSETLEEGVSAGLVEESTTTGRYQFTHALIQETLLSEIPAIRRARLHGLIGEALEVVVGGRLEEYASELAHHYEQAEPVLGKQKLVCYSMLAGDHALQNFAYDEAVAHFERAL